MGCLHFLMGQRSSQKVSDTEFTFIFLLAAAALETNPFLFIINEVKLALKYSLGFRILMLNPSSTHLRWVAYTFW
ncbi:hypothetical protein BN14_13047, partial (mitochondrion) [Rhizoctonia solani AG-1 IB]